LDTPTCSAIVRVLQWVSPSGVAFWVSSTIRSITSCGIVCFRPRPGTTFPSVASPRTSNWVRHERTVTAVAPTVDAITVFATPSAASSSARARCTSRCGAVRDTDNFSNTCR
jgi:hypothetical protein